MACPLTKCKGILVLKRDDAAGKVTWTCLECGIGIPGHQGSSIYKHPIDEGHPDDHDAGGCAHCHDHCPQEGQCCHDGHCHHEEINEADLPTKEAFRPTKVGKNGKIEGFDPGAILDAAQKSLATAMQAYNARTLPKAIRLLEHHIEVFEGDAHV